MVAFWQSLETRSSAVPAAARDFPHEATETANAPASDDGRADAHWATLFDWPHEADGSLGDGSLACATPAAADAAREVALRPVQPVWELVHDSAASREASSLHTLEAMPAYEQCFQGLC